MKHLNRLEPAINQPRHAIEKSKAKNIPIKKKQHRRTRNGKEFLLEPTAALRLRPEKRRRNFIASTFLRQHARFLVRIFIVLLDVARQPFDVVMNQRMLEARRLTFDVDMFMDLHICHRRVLILQPALVLSLPAPKQ